VLSGLDDRASQRGDPRILLGPAENGTGEAAAVPEHPAGPAQRSTGLGHQHEGEAAQDPVDAVVREVDPLRVHDTALDIAKAPGWCTAPGSFDHGRGDVGRDQPSAGTDALGREEASLSGPGREFENGLARPRRDLVDQPF